MPNKESTFMASALFMPWSAVYSMGACASSPLLFPPQLSLTGGDNNCTAKCTACSCHTHTCITKHNDSISQSIWRTAWTSIKSCTSTTLPSWIYKGRLLVLIRPTGSRRGTRNRPVLSSCEWEMPHTGCSLLLAFPLQDQQWLSCRSFPTLPHFHT